MDFDALLDHLVLSRLRSRHQQVLHLQVRWFTTIGLHRIVRFVRCDNYHHGHYTTISQSLSLHARVIDLYRY